MLKKLGYDDQLRSLKSRVFVVSFHSNSSLNVKINDILEGNMHKASLGILMDHYYDEEHEDLLIDSESWEDHEILKIKLK